MSDPDTNHDGIVSKEEAFAHQGSIGGSLIAGTMGTHFAGQAINKARTGFGGRANKLGFGSGRPNPSQNGFGSGRMSQRYGAQAASTPKPPKPLGLKIPNPKRALEIVSGLKPAKDGSIAMPTRLAQDLNIQKLNPDLRDKLLANASLSAGERKSVMEVTGWDSDLLRIVAPYVQAGTRLDAEIGAKIAKLIDEANTDPVKLGGQLMSAQIAFDAANAAAKKASSMASSATRSLEKMRQRDIMNPNAAQVKALHQPAIDRRNVTEAAKTAAMQKRDEARAILEQARIAVDSLENVKAAAQAEVQRITEALGHNRPYTTGTAFMPPYNPLAKVNPGGAFSGVKSAAPAAARVKPSKVASEELGWLLFERDMAETFAKIQSGELKPTPRGKVGMALQWAARHPMLSVVPAGAAVLAGVGLASIAGDLNDRSKKSREVARQRQAEPEIPGFKWDWDTQSRKRDFVVDLQSDLSDIGYNIGRIDGSMYRKDNKETDTMKAVKHFLWTLDPTRAPEAPMTDAERKILGQMAMEYRRKKAS